jgi:peroxiredoxin Q/BCP
MKRRAVLALLLAACIPTGRAGRGGERKLLAVGAQAPDIAARDQSNVMRTLREYRGRVVVLYFYPRDGTPGCTREACAFRDAWDRLSAAGAQVLGVSTDSVESHRDFAESHRIRFPLLADTDGRVCARFGVGSSFGMASRVTYVIDGQGIVRRVFPSVDPAVHVTEVLAAIEAIGRPAAP